MKLNEFAAEVHALAAEKGWWEPVPSFPEVITMVHCELSEAIQEYREGAPNVYYACGAVAANGGRCGGKEMSDCYYAKTSNGGVSNCPYIGVKPEGVAVELADAILRILDYCAFAGIDIESVLEEKHEYNKGREYRHGGKLI